jgi:hypothetical protein
MEILLKLLQTVAALLACPSRVLSISKVPKKI